jgi:phosphoenolpyruvate carboxykinase (ATP)
MVRAALEGKLDDAPMRTGRVFGLQVPQECPGVPPEVLFPRTTWPDTDAYDAQTRKLADMFAENFKQFSGNVDDTVRAAGPRVG